MPTTLLLAPQDFQTFLHNDGTIVEFYLYFMIILFKSRGNGGQLASKTASEASASASCKRLFSAKSGIFDI